MNIICPNCNCVFEKTQWNQIYCGSKSKKIGCSYLMHIKRIGHYNQTKNKKYMNDYIKKWMKNQRKHSTDYAKRQRELKRDYSLSQNGKSVSRRWRHKNIEKILSWNRKRMLKKKGVKGYHTLTEWNELKKKHQYKCMKCGILEKELLKKWKNTNFTKLTRDHIIPISKGGTDYITNILPLCVSCNSKKKDNL
jgi:hypothetical protein